MVTVKTWRDKKYSRLTLHTFNVGLNHSYNMHGSSLNGITNKKDTCPTHMSAMHRYHQSCKDSYCKTLDETRDVRYWSWTKKALTKIRLLMYSAILNPTNNYSLVVDIQVMIIVVFLIYYKALVFWDLNIKKRWWVVLDSNQRPID